MLELEFTTHGRRWQVDLSVPVDLAIPLAPAFGADAAPSRPVLYPLRETTP